MFAAKRPESNGKRILFTGGSGKAGKHMVPWLYERGYEIVNADLKPLKFSGVRDIVADITDSGQMFNLINAYELDDYGKVQFDAVVHFAAIPAIHLVPDNETFRVNTMGTYNVIEAAVKLGVRKIIIASSETTYGVCFAQGHRDYKYLPLDEDYPVDPMDSYALSKVVNERTAQAFQLRSGIDIYALRIGNVIEPHEYDNFPTYFADPSLRQRIAWSYIDTRDLAQIVHLCIEKDQLGFQIFNAANDTSSATQPNAELLKQFYPDVPLRGEIGTHEGLLLNRKIREQLGFKEQHNWHKYVPGHASLDPSSASSTNQAG